MKSNIQYFENKKILNFTIDDPKWDNNYKQDPLVDGFRPIENYSTSNLIPDHGKIMHMFLIKLPQKNAFAHIHPEKINDRLFSVVLPPLPNGNYEIYADIVHENGFSETLVDNINISSSSKNNSSPEIKKIEQDPDDSWQIYAKPTDQSGTNEVSYLNDGYKMIWKKEGKIVAGRYQFAL